VAVLGRLEGERGSKMGVTRALDLMARHQLTPDSHTAEAVVSAYAGKRKHKKKIGWINDFFLLFSLSLLSPLQLFAAG
jgi:hypothetical protein